ncbi:hypothetical protein DFH06DRAFT_1476341 [Mycena polygramma]|nr:hypothetical protein DFH06DRAFT_1476341 [Mycena polygramma]
MSPKKVDPAAVLAELGEIFAWKPPPLVQSPESSSLCPQLTLPPHAFYDKHVDDRLSLRFVKPLASLANDISNVTSMHVDSIAERGLLTHLPSEGIQKSLWAPEGEGKTVVDATDVATFYANSTAALCLGIVTKLFLAPASEDWSDTIIWWRYGHSAEGRVARDENYGIVLPNRDGRMDFVQEELECMDPEMIDNLKTVIARAPFVGTWQILAVCPETHRLLQDLGRVDAFPYKRCRTANAPPTLPSPLRQIDASATPWTIPPVGTHSDTGTRRSNRLKSSLSTTSQLSQPTRPAKRQRGGNSPTPVIPAVARRPSSTAHSSPKLTTESLLQLAWCRAVRTDMTIIVFNCGNFERIGIRHRQTQTLYLSPLIDVTNMESGYAKLHVGLYITMIQDTIDRTAQRAKTEERPLRTRGEKRSYGDAPSRASKRRKTSHVESSEPLATESAVSVASTRNLVLLYIQYDVYNSPVPASFIRSAPALLDSVPDRPFAPPPVKRRYEQGEYTTIILTSAIAAGATGIAHNAILKVTTAEGATLEETVVVKITFTTEQQDRLRHEYEVYRRLANVQGVPKIYGIFDDLEGGAIVLVMTCCGECLWTLRPDPGAKVSISPTQRAQFLTILENIHRAGVRHHDIRAENLMLTEIGEAFIIDFDRADFDPTTGKKRREMERLASLLDGSYPDSDLASPVTTRASENPP